MQFLQNLDLERVSQVRTVVQNFIVVAFKMWVYNPQNREKGNFWYKSAPKGKFRGRQKKLNINAQLQTPLYAMTS